MTRSLACFLAAAVALAAPAAVAQTGLDQGSVPPVRPVTGTVVKWNAETRSFTLRMGNGPNEVEFFVTDQTSFEPRPEVGDLVTVRYRKESRTRFVAERVTARPRQSPPKQEGKPAGS
jgi:hypothetical protein